MRWSRPTAFCDCDDVGACRLADVRDLVDEAHARHEGGVRCELDHLGRGDVRPDDARVDSLVERCDDVGVGLVERADHDPIGVHEVAYGGALGSELGVRDIADVLLAALVQSMAYRAARSDGNGALHRKDDPVVDLRQLVDDGPHIREVGVSRVRRRRADGDVDDLGAGDSLGDVRGERQALAVSLEKLVETGLVDRDDAASQSVDLRLDDVANDDVMAELGETRAGDEPHVSSAEDGDAHGASSASRSRAA